MSTPSAPLLVAFRDWRREVSSCGFARSSSGKHNNDGSSQWCLWKGKESPRKMRSDGKCH